jgi:hypothetical protein
MTYRLSWCPDLRTNRKKLREKIKAVREQQEIGIGELNIHQSNKR